VCLEYIFIRMSGWSVRPRKRTFGFTRKHNTLTFGSHSRRGNALPFLSILLSQEILRLSWSWHSCVFDGTWQVYTYSKERGDGKSALEDAHGAMVAKNCLVMRIALRITIPIQFSWLDKTVKTLASACQWPKSVKLSLLFHSRRKRDDNSTPKRGSHKIWTFIWILQPIIHIQVLIIV